MIKRCKPPAPGSYKKGQLEFVQIWLLLCWNGKQNRTKKAVSEDGVGLEVEDTSSETETDEEEVDGIWHADDNDVNELKCN